MKVVAVWLSTLQDLMLFGANRIYRFKDLYYIGQIAVDVTVVWVVRYKERLGKFIGMENLTIKTSDEQKHGYVPIIDVEKFEEFSSYERLK